jgi:hypothetical protein
MKKKPLFDFWGYFPMGDKYVVLHHLSMVTFVLTSMLR